MMYRERESTCRREKKEREKIATGIDISLLITWISHRRGGEGKKRETYKEQSTKHVYICRSREGKVYDQLTAPRVTGIFILADQLFDLAPPECLKGRR